MVKQRLWGNCNFDTWYAEKSLEGNVTVISFRKPQNNIEKCQLWIQLCGRPHYQLNTQKINNILMFAAR